MEKDKCIKLFGNTWTKIARFQANYGDELLIEKLGCFKTLTFRGYENTPIPGDFEIYRKGDDPEIENLKSQLKKVQAECEYYKNTLDSVAEEMSVISLENIFNAIYILNNYKNNSKKLCDE